MQTTITSQINIRISNQGNRGGGSTMRRWMKRRAKFVGDIIVPTGFGIRVNVMASI